MRAEALRRLVLCMVCLAFVAGFTAAQKGSRPRPTKPILPVQTKPTQQSTPEALPEPTSEPSPEEDKQEDILKIDTNLVVVPVIATDDQGLYLPDLRKEEFNVAEDGVKQEVAFFAAVNAPFNVVLLLDTSASTQEKLVLIKRAASAFVDQLQNADRVKVISFAESVQDLGDFTNDRGILKAAIERTKSGAGTKLYDAFELGINSLRSIKGRKAIVLFSDGVDWHSDSASFDGTLRTLDEEGVIVYAIRYDTRAESERIAREATNEQSPQLPTIGVIRRPAPGTTVPTFPSEEPDTIPTTGQRTKTGPLGLPTADEILRRRREAERDRYPDGNRIPPPDERRRQPDDKLPQPDIRARREDDSIGAMLDQLYLTADSYLKALADKTGGQLLRADTLGSLPDAFAKIAAELRTQYAIGYYPTNKTVDDKYRRIKVKSTRKGTHVRARPGYRTASRR